MKHIDFTLHYLNDAEINEAFVEDFELKMLGTNYDLKSDEKKEVLELVRDELLMIIHKLVQDHSNCNEFTEWLTDYIIPEVRAIATVGNKEKLDKYNSRDKALHKYDFQLEIAPTEFDNTGDFEEDLRTKIANILYEEFKFKSIFHLQICQRKECNNIYIPKRLDPKARFCSYDCKQEFFRG